MPIRRPISSLPMANPKFLKTKDSNVVDDGNNNQSVNNTTNTTTSTKGITSFIDTLPSSYQAIVLSLAMFIFFAIHNLLQEAMMKRPGFKYGVMLGHMEVLGVAVWSYLERRFIVRERIRVAPLSAYPLLTLCLMSSASLSNMSLNYINFPTKVVFRSCKLIPTMIVATVINKKVFLFGEYLCAVAVCAGLILFAAADWKLTPSFNPMGLVLVSLSVVADSILPNLQENLFMRGSSRLEVTMFTNIFTLIAMTITTLMSGDLVGALTLAMTDRTLAVYMGIYTAIAYVAISLFMSIVKRFGAVVGVLLGTIRKGVTLILSFLLFPKAFSWCYVVGAGLVLMGIMVASLIKQNSKKSVVVVSNGYDNNKGSVVTMDIESSSNSRDR